jgi:hypothetical protein
MLKIFSDSSMTSQGNALHVREENNVAEWHAVVRCVVKKMTLFLTLDFSITSQCT